MKYGNIREEELEVKVAKDFFKEFGCTQRLIGGSEFSPVFELAVIVNRL